MLADVERSQRLGQLGDLAGIRHLEPSLRQFLETHPEFDCNVFVMMRLIDSSQMNSIFATVKETLAARIPRSARGRPGLHRASCGRTSRCTWLCSKYGIAVFEDIETRDFNPNVSLELG